MTPLPGNPGNPGNPWVSSHKLDVAGFYNEFGTVAFLCSLKNYMSMFFALNLAPGLGFYNEKLHVDDFYREFGTCARPTFYKKLYDDDFYNEFSTFTRPVLN